MIKKSNKPFLYRQLEKILIKKTDIENLAKVGGSVYNEGVGP